MVCCYCFAGQDINQPSHTTAPTSWERRPAPGRAVLLPQPSGDSEGKDELAENCSHHIQNSKPSNETSLSHS